MSQPVIEAYLETHNQLRKAVAGQSEEQLKWKPEALAWSVTEVLSHLADHNIVVSFRLRDILAGSEARLPAFDQDGWVNSQKANEVDTAEILEVFHSLLRYNGLLLARLTYADWQKTGVTARGDQVRIADVIAGFTKHVQTHLGQISRTQRAAAEAKGSLVPETPATSIRTEHAGIADEENR